MMLQQLVTELFLLTSSSVSFVKPMLVLALALALVLALGDAVFD